MTGIKKLCIFLKLIYFWLCWVFIAACGLSLAAASRGYSPLWCTGFSLWWPLSVSEHGLQVHGPQQLWCTGFSSYGTQASAVVAHRLHSCGARAQPLHGMWNPPGPGLKPVSPALASGFLTTAPPGKSQVYLNFKRPP